MWRVDGRPVKTRAGYRPDVDGPALEISDRPEVNRYEAHLGAELAGFIDYRRIGGRLVLIHTEVLPAFEGRGVATALARHVLGAARAGRERVRIMCPYLTTFVERHPELRPAADGRIPEAGGA